ncbi:hypothetical protein ADUPG1_008779, partial [Aduncisulcus paluster]
MKSLNYKITGDIKTKSEEQLRKDIHSLEEYVQSVLSHSKEVKEQVKSRIDSPTFVNSSIIPSNMRFIPIEPTAFSSEVRKRISSISEKPKIVPQVASNDFISAKIADNEIITSTFELIRLLYLKSKQYAAEYNIMSKMISSRIREMDINEINLKYVSIYSQLLRNKAEVFSDVFKRVSGVSKQLKMDSIIKEMERTFSDANMTWDFPYGEYDHVEDAHSYIKSDDMYILTKEIEREKRNSLPFQYFVRYLELWSQNSRVEVEKAVLGEKRLIIEDNRIIVPSQRTIKHDSHHSSIIDTDRYNNLFPITSISSSSKFPPRGAIVPSPLPSKQQLFLFSTLSSYPYCPSMEELVIPLSLPVNPSLPTCIHLCSALEAEINSISSLFGPIQACRNVQSILGVSGKIMRNLKGCVEVLPKGACEGLTLAQTEKKIRVGMNPSDPHSLSSSSPSTQGQGSKNSTNSDDQQPVGKNCNRFQSYSPISFTPPSPNAFTLNLLKYVLKIVFPLNTSTLQPIIHTHSLRSLVEHFNESEYVHNMIILVHIIMKIYRLCGIVNQTIAWRKMIAMRKNSVFSSSPPLHLHSSLAETVTYLHPHSRARREEICDNLSASTGVSRVLEIVQEGKSVGGGVKNAIDVLQRVKGGPFDIHSHTSTFLSGSVASSTNSKNKRHPLGVARKDGRLNLETENKSEHTDDAGGVSITVGSQTVLVTEKDRAVDLVPDEDIINGTVSQHSLHYWGTSPFCSLTVASGGDVTLQGQRVLFEETVETMENVIEHVASVVEMETAR